NLGALLIALEVYDPGWTRWSALITGGVLLLGTFYILVDQSVQTAFRRGSIFFFTYPVMGSVAFTFALVLVAGLGGGVGGPALAGGGAGAAHPGESRSSPHAARRASPRADPDPPGRRHRIRAPQACLEHRGGDRG